LVKLLRRTGLLTAGDRRGLGKVLERVLDLLKTPARVAGQHVDEAEGVLHALVVVVLGQEAHLAGSGQLRHLEGQLLLRLLDIRAQFRLHGVVELVRLVRVTPDAHLACVVDGSAQQTAAQQKSGKDSKSIHHLGLRKL